MRPAVKRVVIAGPPGVSSTASLRGRGPWSSRGPVLPGADPTGRVDPKGGGVNFEKTAHDKAGSKYEHFRERGTKGSRPLVLKSQFVVDLFSRHPLKSCVTGLFL